MHGSIIPLLFGSSEFSPSEIAGLKLWLDATQISQADGTTIANWNDRSGNNANFGIGSTSSQPTFKTNIINNKPVARFDGVDDYLDLIYPFDRKTTAQVSSVHFHPSGNFLAVSNTANSPYLFLYQRNGDTFQYVSGAVNTQPTGTGRGLKWSPNGDYLCVTHSTSPFFSVYKFNSTAKTLTKLTNPTTLPPATATACCWTSDSNQIFIACSSGGTNRLLTYTLNQSTDVLTNQNNGVVISNTLTDVTITSDDGHVCVTYSNASPYIELFTYNKTTYQLTSLGATQPNVIPTGAAQKCAFSPDGNFLAVAHTTSPFLSVYYRSGSTYTKLSNPTTLPLSNGNAVAWSSDSKYIIHGSSSSTGAIYSYEKSGTGASSTLTKLSTPDQLLIATPQDFAFGASDAYVAVASSSAQFLQIYAHNAGVFTAVTKHNMVQNVAGSTVFIVYKEDSYPASSISFFNISTGSSTTNQRSGVGIASTGFFQTFGRTVDGDSLYTFSATAPYNSIGTHIITNVSRNTSGQLVGYLDAIQAGTVSGMTSSNTSDTTSRMLFLGRALTSNFSSIDIAEVIIYSRELTSGELSQVHTFLQNKYYVYDPRQISGLQLYLDASTINQADNTAVTSWTDLSGNAVSVTQATTANQPVFRTNVQNGLGVVRFDGVDDYLSIAGTGILQNVAGATIIAVIKYNNSATQKTAVHFMRGTGTSGPRATLVSTSSNLYSSGGRRLDSEGTQSVVSTQSSGNFAIQTGVFNFAATTLNQYINNAVDGTSNSFQTAGNTSNTASLAAYVGASSVTPTEFLTGDVCEILVYNRALNSTELRNLHRHLGRKWGITLA